LAFLPLSIPKKARTYDTVAIFRIPAPQKGPEQETVGIFATFNTKKRPGPTILLQFLEFLLLKRGTEHDTLSIPKKART
jgi:hypothetical protein